LPPAAPGAGSRVRICSPEVQLLDLLAGQQHSIALHFGFLRTLNFRVSVVGRSSFAGGFFSLTARNFEGSGFGGFFSAGGWSSLR
jgi:hypothetical protein